MRRPAGSGGGRPSRERRLDERVGVEAYLLSGEEAELAPLTLARGRTIGVVARDLAGRGVPFLPITLLPPGEGPLDHGPMTGPGGYGAGLGAVPTDEVGRVRFLVTQLGSPDLWSTRRLRALAVIHGGRWIDARREVDAGDVELALELPDTITLDLEAESPGEPLKIGWCRGEQVSWPTEEHISSGGGARLGHEATLRRRTGSWSAEVGEASVSVGGFQPGETLTFRIERAGHAMRDVTLTLPRGPGPHRLRFAPGPPLPRVRLKLVDDAGRPVDPEGLRASPWSRDDRVMPDFIPESVSLHVRPLAARGELGIALPAEEERVLELLPPPGWVFRQEDGTLGWNGVFVPAMNPGESRDLGSFTLVPARNSKLALVAGRVVDAAGRGVGGAEILIRRNQHFAGDPPQGWPVGSATSEAQGDFHYVLRGSSQPWGYTATVVGDFVSEPRVFAAHARDVELVVRPAGALAGRLVPRDARFLQKARLLLHADHLEHPRWVTIGEEGWFLAGRLRPARYALEICLGEGSPRQRERLVSDLEVRSGETSRPMALQRIALGEAFDRAEVEVLDPAGRPLEGALVRWSGGEGAQRFRIYRRTDHEGRTWTPLRRGVPTELRVRWRRGQETPASFAGRPPRGITLESPAWPARMTLRPHPELRVRLEAPLPETVDGKGWHLTLGRLRSEDRMEALQARRGRPVAPFTELQTLRLADDARELVFDRAEPGSLCLVVRGEDWNSRVIVSRFTLDEGVDGESLVLDLEPEQIQRIRSMGR